MKRLILSMLVVMAIAAIATVSIGCKSDNTSSGNTELQGTWTAADPTDSTTTVTFTFNGNQWTMGMGSTGMSIQFSGTFTIDTKANPKTIDMVFTSIPFDMGNETVGQTALGIYEITGNELKIEMGDSDEARPTSFSEDNSITLTKQ